MDITTYIRRNIFSKYCMTINSLHLWKVQWTKFGATGDLLSRGLLERFSEGLQSIECVLFYPDPLRSHFISFINALWLQRTFASRNSNSHLEDSSWATWSIWLCLYEEKLMLNPQDMLVSKHICFCDPKQDLPQLSLIQYLSLLSDSLGQN